MPDEQTFRQFCAAVTLHPYLERVPQELRQSFLDPIAQEFAHDRPAYMLDYWRLNIFARKPR
jgi:trans-aconitate methyltransferase